MKKRTYSTLIGLLTATALLLTSCGAASTNAIPPFDPDTEPVAADGGVLAQNSRFQLLWDDGRNTLLLATAYGDVWGSAPFEAYSDGELDPEIYGALNAGISIRYSDPSSGQIRETDSYDGAHVGGRVSTKRIDDGLRIEYYFDREEFMIPVEYRLTENGLKASVAVRDIQEGSNILSRVSLLPYLASVPNNGDGYLFVPSGCGAVMSVEEREYKALYSEPVYGRDMTQLLYYQDSNSESIRLPVFGVKNGERAMLGVITDGSEAGWVEAVAGDTVMGFSSAYATFQLRGEEPMETWTIEGMPSTITVSGKALSNEDYLSVEYYPLHGDKADLIGMAECYRDYLTRQGMVAGENTEPLLYVDVIGGALAKQDFLGFPYTALYPTTTFKQTQTIASELQEAVGTDGLALKLSGFGGAGLDPAAPVGGMTFSPKLGGMKGYTALRDWCKKQNVLLFADFDLSTFAKGGSGLSTWADAAKQVSGATAQIKRYSFDTHQQTGKTAGYYIGRSHTLELARTLKKKLAKKLSGVSFDSLSRISYSDYSDNESYPLRYHAAQDAQTVFSEFKDAGLPILATSANAYAAARADYIIAAPTSSSALDVLKEDVPFYQMVFKGTVPLSSIPINLTADVRQEFLTAVSTGSALCFTVYDAYATSLRSSRHDVFLAGDYAAIREDILAMTQEMAPFFRAVNGAAIVGYEQADGVTCTRFDNGVTVYVNFTENPVQTPLGTLAARGFTYGR